MVKLVDMKRTKAEKTAEKKRFDKPMGDGEDYPYGLSVRLDHHAIKKLGISTMPKAGDKIHLHARAHVKSVEHTSRDGEDRGHIELELRHMAVAATKRASEEEVHEGDLTGAKAAMDKALDAQEGTTKGGKKGKQSYEAPNSEGGEED